MPNENNDKFLLLSHLTYFKGKFLQLIEGLFPAREMTSANGKALIFNESDGGGVKFEHSDGTWSFVGVNDGGEDGVAGQLYTVQQEGGRFVGTRLNMTKDGFYYLPNSNSSQYTASDEIATKGFVGSQGFVTQGDVSSAISEAVAGLGSLTKVVANAVPTAGEADEDVLYYVMNATTGYYDIYQLIGDEVVRLDDVSIDLSGYVRAEDLVLATTADIDAMFA